jgi:hypothetical protein
MCDDAIVQSHRTTARSNEETSVPADSTDDIPASMGLHDAMLCAADWLLTDYEPLESITTIAELTDFRESNHEFADDFCNRCAALIIRYNLDAAWTIENLLDYIFERATE